MLSEERWEVKGEDRNQDVARWEWGGEGTSPDQPHLGPPDLLHQPRPENSFCHPGVARLDQHQWARTHEHGGDQRTNTKWWIKQSLRLLQPQGMLLLNDLLIIIIIKFNEIFLNFNYWSSNPGGVRLVPCFLPLPCHPCPCQTNFHSPQQLRQKSEENFFAIFQKKTIPVF